MCAAQVSHLRCYQPSAWQDANVVVKEEEAINALLAAGVRSEDDVVQWLSCDDGTDHVEDTCSVLITAIDMAAKERQRQPRVNGAASSGTERERLCTAIMMAHIGREIGQWKEVKSFREKMSQGQMLEESVAWKLITQEIFQVLDFDHFQQHGCCPLKTYGEIAGKEPLSEGGFRFRVSFGEDKNCLHSMSVVHAPEALAVLAHHGGRAASSYVHFFDEANGLLVESGGTFFGDTHLKIRGYWPSVAGRALELTRCIGSAYGWDAHDALRFLLTGHVPAVSLYSLSSPNHWYSDPRKRGIVGSVYISAMPWTQPETLEKFYSERVLSVAGDKSGRLVQPLPSEAELHLYQAVSNQTPVGELPRWAHFCRSEAFQAWKQKYSPNSDANSCRGIVKNAFDRVEKYLARWKDPQPYYYPLWDDENEAGDDCQAEVPC